MPEMQKARNWDPIFQWAKFSTQRDENITKWVNLILTKSQRSWEYADCMTDKETKWYCQSITEREQRCELFIFRSFFLLSEIGPNKRDRFDSHYVTHGALPQLFCFSRGKWREKKHLICKKKSKKRILITYERVIDQTMISQHPATFLLLLLCLSVWSSVAWLSLFPGENNP